MAEPRPTLVLDVEEAEELYRYMLNQYLNPNVYPRLSKLWGRLSTVLRKQEQALAALK